MDKPTPKSRPWSAVIIHPGNNTGSAKIPSGTYNRTERDPFYHTNRWKKASASYLYAHPACARCAKSGLIRASRVTDHIIPKPICRDPYDQSNWQPLCRKCHDLKAAGDKALIAKHNRK